MSGREASGGRGGVEPALKRRRLLNAGGPVEDDETARQKMRDAKVYERGVDNAEGEYVGFDPNNVGDVKSDYHRYDEDSPYRDSNGIKPMDYFARKGDLKMMRWLYVNGADTRYDDAAVGFPMYEAACNYRLDICKWLFAHGAANDIKARTRNRGYNVFRDSPLGDPIDSNTPLNVAKWLILNGALCVDDDSGDLDIEIMRLDLGGAGEWLPPEQVKALLEWAIDLHRARTSFLLFLSGALPPLQHVGLRQLWDTIQRACSPWLSVQPLRLLVGKPGVLELIGDYVGIVRGREARIIRQITEMLPKAFAELVELDDRLNEE